MLIIILIFGGGGGGDGGGDEDDDVEPGWSWWFARLCRPARLAATSSVFSTEVRFVIAVKVKFFLGFFFIFFFGFFFIYFQLITTLKMLKSDPAQNAIADNLDEEDNDNAGNKGWRLWQQWWNENRWQYLWRLFANHGEKSNMWENESQPLSEEAPTLHQLAHLGRGKIDKKIEEEKNWEKSFKKSNTVPTCSPESKKCGIKVEVVYYIKYIMLFEGEVPTASKVKSQMDDIFKIKKSESAAGTSCRSLGFSWQSYEVLSSLNMATIDLSRLVGFHFQVTFNCGYYCPQILFVVCTTVRFCPNLFFRPASNAPGPFEFVTAYVTRVLIFFLDWI